MQANLITTQMVTESRSSVSGRIRRLMHTFRGRNVERNQQDDSRKTDKPIEPPALPFLPAQRPHLLTPTASREFLVVATPGTIFASLPAELRRRVLIAAFGGRTLHIDLRLAHPRLPGTSAAATSGHGEHGGGAAPLSWRYAADRTAPRTWRWWSCVCHRLVPPGSRWERRVLARGVAPYRFPKHDGCIRGDAAFCQLWSSETATVPARRRCAVGSLGWLLACRQA